MSPELTLDLILLNLVFQITKLKKKESNRAFTLEVQFQ